MVRLASVATRNNRASQLERRVRRRDKTARDASPPSGWSCCRSCSEVSDSEDQMYRRPGKQHFQSKRFARLLHTGAFFLLPFSLLVGTGIRGLDFGMHWDEKYYQIRPVRTMVETGVPLPQYYGYPSFDYWVNAAALLPEILRAPVTDQATLRQQLLQTIESHSFLLRLRAIYLIVTSLTVLWVYLLVLVWRSSRIEALLASLFFALSWEVAYHLRWVATDGMLMQFGALTALLCITARVSVNKQRWLTLAAAIAGLGLGTKYPGGLLLVPVLIGDYLRWDAQHSLARRAFSLLRLIVIFAGAFLISTPATLFDTSELIAGVRYEIHHYATGHAGHTISPGIVHGWRILIYFSSVLFSRFTPIALIFFAFCLIGVFDLIKESPRTAVLFLCFPLLYLLYFSLQRAMVVRNLLVVVPYLAVAAARGAAVIWRLLKARSATLFRLGGIKLNLSQAAFTVFLSFCLLINCGWLIYAAETIADRHTDRFIHEAARYIKADSGKRLFLSPRVRVQLASLGSLPSSIVTDDPAQADEVIFFASEGLNSWKDWPANQFWLTTWFGPSEVNFNVYANWWGDDRIVVMSMRKARTLNLLILK